MFYILLAKTQTHLCQKEKTTLHRIHTASENSWSTEDSYWLFFPGRKLRTRFSSRLHKQNPSDPMVEVDTGAQKVLDYGASVLKDCFVFIAGQTTLPLKSAS